MMSDLFKSWDSGLGGSGGVTDHGDLDGLSDDDHPQYVETTGDETIAGVKTFSSIPFLPNAQPTLSEHAVRKHYVDQLVLSYAPLSSFEWTDYTPTWTANTTNPSLGNGTLSGRYLQIGDLVKCQLYLKFGSTTTGGSGFWKFTYPVAPNTTYVLKYQVGSILCFNADGANVFGVTGYGAGPSIICYASNAVTATYPFTWAENDYLKIMFDYEAT